jgi:hypothetical protein
MTLTTMASKSAPGSVSLTHEPRRLPTTDTKGSPREHFNKPLYNQILQARRLLVSEAGSAEKNRSVRERDSLFGDKVKGVHS